MIGKSGPRALMVTVIAGAALAAGSLPATAAPTTPPEGYETSVSYYNNAQHSELVGIVDTGTCYTYKWGTETSYYVVTTGRCN
jgi:hypothetical protein